VDRVSGGRLGASIRGIPSLWLTTVGRTSGTVRTTALYYLDDGPNLVVVASNAGLDIEPGWWRNLRAAPSTTIRIGRQRREVTARVATVEEHDRLWPRLVALNPDYATYQVGTSRQIPVVILESREGD
jgi:deazaflavin-dependent oxidoreductase (nitroreductase family)